MAVKRKKSPPEIPPITQPHDLLSGSVPVVDTDPTNQHQEIKNMEVHKHPHHVLHKKKWREYLLEFLMIFLAVFLGFFAENIREQKVESYRAQEYAISLVNDLHNDSISVSYQLKISERYISISDSLLEISNQRLEGRTAAKFSFYTRFIYWTIPINWNRATFEQIKNSGNLRYFKNYQLLEKLMKYQALINEIEGEFQNHQTRCNVLLNHINKVIDPGFHRVLSGYNLMSMDMISDKARESFYSYKFESLEDKRPAICEMLNMTIAQQRNLRANSTRLIKAKELASDLRNDLKKEYNIE